MSTPRRDNNPRIAPEHFCVTCNHRRAFHGMALTACTGVASSCCRWSASSESQPPGPTKVPLTVRASVPSSRTTATHFVPHPQHQLIEVPLQRLAGVQFHTPRRGVVALTTKDIGRIEAKVTVLPNGCWNWNPPPTPEGYAQMGFMGSVHLVHHLLNDLVNGAPAEGEIRGHRCHDEDLDCPGGKNDQHRRCVNPAHIVLQTIPQNLAAGRGPWSTRRMRSGS